MFRLVGALGPPIDSILRFYCSSVGKVYWQVLAGRVISGVGGAGMTALV